MSIQFLQNDPCLAGYNSTDIVEADNSIHVLEINDDLIKHRDTTANQTRVSSLRDDCQLAVVTILQYL